MSTNEVASIAAGVGAHTSPRRVAACAMTMRNLAMLMIVASAMAMVLCGCRRQSPSPQPGGESREAIIVFAAASTVDVMSEAARLFREKTGVEVKCSFEASSALAKQIINGAPADVFLSADEKWMDEAEKARAIEPESRRDLLGNTLVLIAPRARPLEVRMEREFSLTSALPQNARLALADPSHVPAGRYAQQALEHLGWWAAIATKVVAAQDVRAALRLVERGEADAGIVYATDAKASSEVVVLGEFPPESHELVRYPIALVKGASPRAAEFIAFLQGTQAERIFTEAGFKMPIAEH